MRRYANAHCSHDWNYVRECVECGEVELQPTIDCNRCGGIGRMRDFYGRDTEPCQACGPERERDALRAEVDVLRTKLAEVEKLHHDYVNHTAEWAHDRGVAFDKALALNAELCTALEEVVLAVDEGDASLPHPVLDAIDAILAKARKETK